MTHYPPSVLAPVLNVSEAQARLLLGCVHSRRRLLLAAVPV